MTDNSSQISEGKLKQTLAIVASVIEEHGDEFWPVFDMLENELNKRRKRRRKLQKRLSDAQSFK